MPGQEAQAPRMQTGEREVRSTESAYTILKAKILASELAPGTQVTEQALTRELGMSRTPVREALVRLQHEGLLEIVPRHGMRISTLAPSDMREIYEILVSLEPTAVELLTLRRPGREDLASLIEACDRMEQALASDPADLRRWAEADALFHTNLVLLCGNRRLAAMVMTVSEQAQRARTFTLMLRKVPHRSTAEHRAVVEAILQGDAQHARQLYDAHRRTAGVELMSIIERHGLNRL